jgi:chromosome segregation ATPase|uniref:Coiled-coil domain-containing protein 39 n=1 Tax=Eutreptiella gymnastica TaxID=73025 RepID=A0A7S4FGB3_9EUGL|mmetsp:Transcript_54563/g.90898  ORF Transcript_54563/g.90898 Transcript_54563/m.90898 type:complete len:892 (+) Transcript_54563:80-2755(+)|eukprot:CAMPEP_0174329372 /NCGR_PEP_ID=MMETSP0810-20121108/15783_1 /TAXON_ID=73025 ORGANISM="Eutreptiella gymnastica-like, Strain CCMP1594" /NCGR_SAMPLE_ID=MMETSP0810 /ASSEMBLY_ACC=CAM_ASM_000659 /LENGTH=891 /DNA_ID=CAMNT_0015443817 /DNA_START=80 /DNA_END=2755 /DNA_ORIENTATION=+
MADDDGGLDIMDGTDVLPDAMLNKVNKGLKAQILLYEQEVENKAKDISDNKTRLNLMSEHLVNVRTEIKNTQELCEAKKREIETEDHMAQLAERTIGRVKAEMKTIAQQKTEIQDKLDNIQNSIFQGNMKMDDFKAHMNFNQEELEQWDLARKQKEDDALALQKYHRADDAKIKELNLQIEKLSRAVLDKKKDLEREITETQAAQIELDKTAEDFKNLHKERQDLIRQWEEAIQAMHRRDEAIKGAGEQFAEGKAWQVKRTEQLQDRAAFLNIEVQNNKEMENKIAQEERVLSKYRNDHFLISQHLGELDDELEVLKNTLAKASLKLNQKKTQKTNLMNNLKDKQEGFNKMQVQAEKTTLKLQKEIEMATDLEKQSKLINDMLTETENTFKELDREMNMLKEEQYLKSQELFNVRKSEANLLAEISGAQAQNKNMLAKVNQLDQETFKQQELLYNIEFQVQQMERKVNRAKGERTEEEKKELKEKIDMLQTMLDDLQKQYKVLDLQVKRVLDDVRQSKMTVESKTTEKNRQNNIILELTLENESCQVELGKLTKNKEQLMVNHDVLKLQVNRLDKILMNRGKELYSLENRKAQLQITIEERESEIAVHKDMLRMQIKTSEDERRKVVMELRERQNQVQHLKNRFQVLVNRMNRDEDDMDGEMTHAQYIVKTAKEREELQAQGDALDEEIKRMEKEAKKLDKTILTLKGCNSAFKSQFKKATQGDPEAQTKEALEQKHRELQTLINRRTNDMKDYLKNEMGKMAELQDCSREKQELQHKVHILKEGLEGVNKNISEYQNVIGRVNTAIAKLRKNVDDAIQRDVELQEEKECDNQVILSLANLAQSSGDEVFSQALSDCLQRYEIEAPRPPSARSDGAPSRTSSVSSSAHSQQ